MANLDKEKSVGLLLGKQEDSAKNRHINGNSGYAFIHSSGVLNGLPWARKWLPSREVMHSATTPRRYSYSLSLSLSLPPLLPLHVPFPSLLFSPLTLDPKNHLALRMRIIRLCINRSWSGVFRLPLHTTIPFYLKWNISPLSYCEGPQHFNS